MRDWMRSSGCVSFHVREAKERSTAFLSSLAAMILPSIRLSTYDCSMLIHVIPLSPAGRKTRSFAFDDHHRRLRLLQYHLLVDDDDELSHATFVVHASQPTEGSRQFSVHSRWLKAYLLWYFAHLHIFGLEGFVMELLEHFRAAVSSQFPSMVPTFTVYGIEITRRNKSNLQSRMHHFKSIITSSSSSYPDSIGIFQQFGLRLSTDILMWISTRYRRVPQSVGWNPLHLQWFLLTIMILKLMVLWIQFAFYYAVWNEKPKNPALFRTRTIAEQFGTCNQPQNRISQSTWIR